MRRALRLAIAMRARWPLPVSSATTVLLYHRLDHQRSPLSVSPDAFREQMAVLADQRRVIHPLGFEEALERLRAGQAPHRSVAVTFDDGYADVHAHGLPALLEHRIPALVYVVSGLLDQPGHLSSGQLRELVAAGVDIGAHSRTHVDLRTCGPAELKDEVTGSRSDLEDLLGRPVVSFAYPYGRHDGVVQSQVRAAGYQSAATATRGWVDAGTDRLMVARTAVLGDSPTLLRATSRGGLNILRLAEAVRRHPLGSRRRPASSSR